MPLNIKRQSGLTLIESMVALLVISVGLLGIAALQINSLKQNSSAFWHSQAVLMAHDMADRVRANRAEIVNYVGIDTQSNYSQDCMGSPCNTDQMRLSDAADWTAMLTLIPSGRGIIRAPVADQMDIVVMWDDEGTGATGTACGNNPQVDLTCYTVTMSSL
ncbi:MAG: type IV pilus modification protein PilV [Gammaproteobacteria bacterium]|nr:type IV pilus modification protein PilV [Gammaproteobacteria bacterium]MBL6999396.1 type IV pilus modification protein PilV [Gammaproteobacteria bacterium]